MTTLSRPLALVVLAVQLVSAGIASVAHAREALDAPVRIESTQHQECPVVHDASVCVICSHAHARAVTSSPTMTLGARPIAHAVRVPPSHPRPVRTLALSAAPRGPPLQMI